MNIIQFWNKIPSVIRGLIIGLIIQVIGVIPLFMLIPLNVERFPEIPWVLVIGLLFIWLFWKFFSGQKYIFPGSLNRIDLSRTRKMNSKSIKWTIISGIFLSVTLFSFVFIGYMLAEVPLQQVELISSLKGVPVWTSLSLLLMASLATGLVEEMAWRGYAQRIIEKKNKATLAIIIVALAFTLIHFLPVQIWPLFFLGSLGWGFLAYYSNSIIPGIIFHTLIDFTAFVWALYNLESLKEILIYNVFKDGFNSLFQTLLIIAIISTITTVYSFKNLKSIQSSKIIEKTEE